MKFSLYQLQEIISDWKRLSGDGGYQHNGQHLGEHTKSVIDGVLADRRYHQLPAEYQEIVSLAAFFHDMGKPTGHRHESVVRLTNHESVSAKIAGSELKKLGYEAETINKVKLLIKHDNLMSEFGRSKLHGRKPDVPLPSIVAKRFNFDKRLLTALLILNKADVVAAGRGSGRPGRWIKINQWVNEYFSNCIKEAK